MIDYAKYGVSEYEDGLILKNGGTTIEAVRKAMNVRGRTAFDLRFRKNRKIIERFYRDALKAKECYYGPFVGEFGHFLLHNLPFLMHLHHLGVRIHYCGMAIHGPFLRDEEGRSILAEYHSLRDFFGEVKPMTNRTEPPKDVMAEIEIFKQKARDSSLPFLDISQRELYWNALRNIQIGRWQHVYDLSKVYGEGKKNTAVIFPRKKGGATTENNGGPWDYAEVARTLSPHFDHVYLVGHPSLSAEVEPEGNIEVKVSQDNTETLRYCAEARLIVTQHSGAVHIGGYVDTPVLIIYNGKPPIRGLFDTIRFRRFIARRPLQYAFGYEEIENQISKMETGNPQRITDRPKTEI